MATKNTISEQVWDEQAILYELGFKHANEIAGELSVSPQTVSRQMNRRGAKKGSRVSETVEGLVAALERKARCAALMKFTDSERRTIVAAENSQAVGRMVAALIEADHQGDLSKAAPVIDRMGMALGTKRRARSKK